MKRISLIILLMLSVVALLSSKEITVRMLGMVQSPGSKQIELGTGLIGLIYQSGGAKFGGCPKSVFIKTEGAETSNLSEVNAYEIVMKGLPDVMLRENQTIWIPENVIPCLSADQIREFNQQLPIYLKLEPAFHRQDR